MRTFSTYTDRHKRGLTLPEVMLAMAVLLFIVAALTQAVVAGQMHVYEAVHEVRATALVESLMDEVLSKPYADPDGASNPGPEAGEDDRDELDNADDFQGFTEAAGAVSDFTDTLYPEAYQSFTRSVSAVYTTRPALGEDHTGLLVTVTVRDADGRLWVVERFMPEPVE